MFSENANPLRFRDHMLRFPRSDRRLPGSDLTQTGGTEKQTATWLYQVACILC